MLRELAEPETRPWRLGGTLFVLFGAAALFVATAGVYALLSLIVTQRSREIGVRLALGATPAGTRGMIVRQSLGWVVAGLALGLIAALAVGRFISRCCSKRRRTTPRVRGHGRAAADGGAGGEPRPRDPRQPRRSDDALKAE